MGFFDTDRWNEIWQTIRRNRKRSIMTALGVFWGIFMLTVLLGAGMGLGRLFRAQLGETSTNTVLMNTGRTSIPYKGMPTPGVEPRERRRRGHKKLPEGEIRRRHWGQPVLRQPRRPQRILRHGPMPDYQKINPKRKLVYGRSTTDMERKRKVLPDRHARSGRTFPRRRGSDGQDDPCSWIAIHGRRRPLSARAK